MATIRIAQSKNWTEDLSTSLAGAGHQVTASGSADVALVDAAGPQQYDGALNIIVASGDEVPHAIARVRVSSSRAPDRWRARSTTAVSSISG